MMPAGSYYVGDLCYVLGDSWDDFCATVLRDGEMLEGECFLPDGRRFASFGTAYGDGVYTDQKKRVYPVDAGLIGCIKVEDMDVKGEVDFTSLGSVIEFGMPFSCSGHDGVIRIGNITIDTNDDGDQDWQ